LLPDRRKRITSPLRNTEEQMRLKSRSLLSRLKSSPSKLQENQTNLKEKLPKLKPPKSSLIRPLKSSRDSIQRDISSTFNGKRLSRTPEREMSSLMRLVRTTLEQRITSRRRRLILRTTRTSFKESKTITPS